MQRPLDEWATELLAVGNMLAQKDEKYANGPKPGVSFRRSFSSPRLAMVGRRPGRTTKRIRRVWPAPAYTPSAWRIRRAYGLFFLFLMKREIDRKYLEYACAASQRRSFAGKSAKRVVIAMSFSARGAFKQHLNNVCVGRQTRCKAAAQAARTSF